MLSSLGTGTLALLGAERVNGSLEKGMWDAGIGYQVCIFLVLVTVAARFVGELVQVVISRGPLVSLCQC